MLVEALRELGRYGLVEEIHLYPITDSILFFPINHIILGLLHYFFEMAGQIFLRCLENKTYLPPQMLED